MSKEYDIKFVIRTVGDRPDEWFNINNYSQLRYSKFQKALANHKAGFIQYKDIINHIYEGKEIPVFEFENNKFKKTKNKGLDATVVATEVFESVPVDYNTKKMHVDDTIKLYSSLEKEGKVNHFVNSIKSLNSQDKKWLLDVQKDMPQIPLSPVYSFETKNQLENFFNEEENKYILKGRLGMAGTATLPLTKKILDELTNETIQNYVVQKDISPIICELRFVYGPNQEQVGTRAYFDRRAPWEDKETSQRKHKPIKYIGSDFEKEISAQIIKYAGVDVGSADWLINLPKGMKIPSNLSTKDFSTFIQENGTYSLAEVNGFGTNFGPMSSPYDLNEEIINKIVDKYL